MVKKIILFALMAVCAAGVSCSRYYRVDEQYDKGDFLKAFRTLQEIRDQDSIHYQRRYYRLVIRLSLQGDRDFILRLRDIATNEPAADLSHYARFGHAYIRFLDARTPEQYQALVTNLGEVSGVPEEFRAYALKIRGIAAYQTGHAAEAVSDLNQSYRMLPGADTLYFLGLCHMDLDDQKTASGYFQKVASGAQDRFYRSLGHYQLGEIEYNQKKYAQALDLYVKAVNEYPQSADYASRISRCLRRLRYFRLSHKFARTALRIRSDYADAWFFLNLN